MLIDFFKYLLLFLSIRSIVLFFSPDSCVFRSGCEVSEALKGTTERHGFPSRKYFSEAIAPIL